MGNGTESEVKKTGGRVKGHRHSYLNSMVSGKHKRLLRACRCKMEADAEADISIGATVEAAVELLAAKLGVTVPDAADDGEV